MPPFSRIALWVTVLLLSLAACTARPSGSVQFAASVQQALSSQEVTRVKVTLSTAEMPPRVVDLGRSNGSWGGLIGDIPAGANHSFLAEAFDASGTRRFQGQTSGVTIAANQTTTVVITLQELAPPAPYANEAPLIDSVVASTTTVQAGGSLSLIATAHDPNTGDALTFAWTASSGTFSAPTDGTSSWTAPSSPGIQTLVFTVKDSQGAAASVSLAVNVVSSTTTGDAAIDVSFNLWPVVSRISASLSRLDAGQSTVVSANASDADGDALSYQWAATCPGTWTDATSSTASFVPSSIPASACNNCRLTVTVQDNRGGQTTGSLNLCVAASSTERFAPLFTHFYQSATSASPGQTVTFDVTAMDPQTRPMTFAWTANMGSLSSVQSTANTSQVAWTAPSCAVTGPPPSITVVVTNDYGLVASRSFSLTGLQTCVTGWSFAGLLATGRYNHTATLLASGKVLVAAGYNGDTSSEVYDPDTNGWSSAGPMAMGRFHHTATLLASGKVLVTGGYGNGSALRSVELYDPATDAWTSVEPMATARYQHTAVLLPSGKVLVTGGINGSSLASAELYDPDTDSWSSAGLMDMARSQHTAVLLPSGKVLVMGGLNGSSLASAELYDPATHAWTSARAMTTARYQHTATLLASGKVLVAGGYTGYFAASEVYDPATNAWSSAGTMVTGRALHTATLLTTGQVFVTGGFNSFLDSTELYDPATHDWSSAGAMATARNQHTATLLSSGKVLVVGGFNGGALSHTETYAP
ncbi:branched-chain amino acid ABC transporter2C amino acid-binding protein [Corallococcus coralloides DSM 2259]|uniref:Branched-chain amino acid ABC transporter2C amino acid-binding protein n=1 Tax=Corallococcus coralloides (strain ATCC 25202 / DSM 2259 / NBRC 100086 / M2) TaxID=1144275 RepID=H8MNE8_CORCM|nr:kelch repeat-containing protein [Corallococcus coralloides]AFE05366.1 branched-chain amino acid ABC transporter2C amino acid-binding protein [Corallococcus coralloides DSM 2259]